MSILGDLHSQSRPEFRRYGVTYGRRHVAAPESAPTDFDNIVQETTPTIPDDSGSVPILSPVVDPPDPSIDLPIALHLLLFIKLIGLLLICILY